MNPLSADQASFMLHTLGLPPFRNEHRITTAVIAAIPAGRADYRPHADSRSALELAWNIVGAEMKYLDAIAAGVFPHDLKPVPDGYLRPMGAKVPPMYGPSHDTGGFKGGRAPAPGT